MTSWAKTELLLFPFCLGVVLMFFSWRLSFPLSITSVDDFVFNHVSPLFWLSMPLLMGSFYLTGISSRRMPLKWLASMGLVVTMYSLSFFYCTLPSSDSNYFRGLNEYVLGTHSIEPLDLSRAYFEWPLFFMLAYLATSLSGLGLVSFEFLLYGVIGLMLTTSVYVYAYKGQRGDALFGVIGFFLMTYYFLDYQAVPFSLAFCLLLLLLALDAHITKSRAGILAALILFTGMVLTHAFVPVFFIIYQFTRYVFSRKKQYVKLFILTIIVHIAVMVFQAPLSLADILRYGLGDISRYTHIVIGTLQPASVPFDAVAQLLSRLVWLAATGICGIGFVALLIKRRVRLLDQSVLLSGLAYMAIGGLVNILGERAIPIVSLPLCLGASHLSKTKFKSYLKGAFLVLVVLFVFVPVHVSFYDSNVFFQTMEDYHVENFAIDRFNQTARRRVLAHHRVQTYLVARQITSASIEHDEPFAPPFPNPRDYDIIVYTVGLGKNLLKHNYALNTILHEERLNLIYDSGLSKISARAMIVFHHALSQEFCSAA